MAVFLEKRCARTIPPGWNPPFYCETDSPIVRGAMTCDKYVHRGPVTYVGVCEQVSRPRGAAGGVAHHSYAVMSAG
ncbi:hypothetical protein Ntsu_12970 [Nocardia sp. IFM 10818]